MSNIVDYIKSHKLQIQYCETVIDKEGNIFDAQPSHQQFLLNRMMKKYDLTENECYKKIPTWSHVTQWMVEDLGDCSVWYDMLYFSEGITKDQLNSIKILQQEGQITNPIKAIKVKEKSKIEFFESHRDYIPDDIPCNEEWYIIDGRLFKA